MNRLTDAHHDWVLQVCGIDSRIALADPGNSGKPEAPGAEAAAGGDTGTDGTAAEPGILDRARVAPQVAGEATGVSGAMRSVEDTAEKVGGMVAAHPLDAALGLGYGVVQGLAPGGFLAPSPDPKSQAFELGRGAGMLAGGLGALATAAGEESVGVAADATGVGAVVGVPLNVLGAVTAASGITAEIAGAATIANAMSMGGDGEGGTPQPVPDKANDISDHALDPANGGQPKPGYRGGQSFANDGRGGGPQLPVTDKSGNPIIYQEWDVNPLVRGRNRGAERVVTGSDQSSYYTGDHYRTFTKIR